MAKINVLDSSVFNLISAGEVVDKPMSVVKELVENSIDAGATKIEVEVVAGGTELIRVSDNGCGIQREDVEKAFLPHATSKIASVEDLNNILTLGFRGEALASIAAVAKVTMVTRTEGDDLAKAVVYDSGDLLSSYDCGAPTGTTVTVENIFRKIPARQKYLRSALSEEADITGLMDRLILANPKISFTYKHSGKELVSTGENEKSALISVYGGDILANTEEVSLIMPDITIRGFIGKPTFSKHSRNFQTFIVNGRYVKSEDLSYAVYLCYKDYLMTRQYPIFVIYIDIPADMVDVNVHPNKLTVKFAQPDRVKKLIMNAVSERLGKAALQPKTLERSDEIAANEDKSEDGKEDNKFDLPKTFGSTPNFRSADERLNEGRTYSARPIPRGATYYSQLTSAETYDRLRKSREYTFGGFMGEMPLVTVGTLFSTYIVVEWGDNCYLIDQHAAHERILYDKLVRQIDSGKPSLQSLLVPYKFTPTAEESRLLDENITIFKQSGFDIAKDGKDYYINAIPSVLSDLNIGKMIPSFFDAIGARELKTSSLMKDVLAQCACKAAVKGDRILSQDEISALLKEMNSLDACLCPHGRPIVVKVSKYEIEKWFKRK